MDQVRVRFAPSPTGHLHIGGLRSAIFNWLFARHHNGKFLLRIEDTDKERDKQEYVDSILGSFAWMAMASDEPIVVQSSRFAQHAELIQKLIDEGKAYRCFCTRTANVPDEENEGGAYSKYDGICRERAVTEKDLQQPYVVRFKLPTFSGDAFSFEDMIYGQLSFPVDQFDDFIIARSNGNPMYNFVVVADDIFMRITHVIRGQEHLINTPKQIMLYKALGAQVPRFAHLPLILGPSGTKLSKREAAVSVLSYKEDGYIAEALFNYLVRLGWSHGDQEVFSRAEIIEFFTLEDVHQHGAVFDSKKLEWLNGVYIRAASSEELVALIERDVHPHWRAQLPQWTERELHALVGLYKERVKTLRELADEISNLYHAPCVYDAQAVADVITPGSVDNIAMLEEVLCKVPEWDVQTVTTAVKKIAQDNNLKLPAFAQPIRLALTGKASSPGVFELLAYLGKAESLRRLQALRNFLK